MFQVTHIFSFIGLITFFVVPDVIPESSYIFLNFQEIYRVLSTRVRPLEHVVPNGPALAPQDAILKNEDFVMFQNDYKNSPFMNVLEIQNFCDFHKMTEVNYFETHRNKSGIFKRNI